MYNDVQSWRLHPSFLLLLSEMRVSPATTIIGQLPVSLGRRPVAWPLFPLAPAIGGGFGVEQEKVLPEIPVSRTRHPRSCGAGASEVQLKYCRNDVRNVYEIGRCVRTGLILPSRTSPCSPKVIFPPACCPAAVPDLGEWEKSAYGIRLHERIPPGGIGLARPGWPYPRKRRGSSLPLPLSATTASENPARYPIASTPSAQRRFAGFFPRS